MRRAFGNEYVVSGSTLPDYSKSMGSNLHAEERKKKKSERRRKAASETRKSALCYCSSVRLRDRRRTVFLTELLLTVTWAMQVLCMREPVARWWQSCRLCRSALGDWFPTIIHFTPRRPYPFAQNRALATCRTHRP